MSNDKYYINIKGKKHPVSREVYKVHESYRKKIKYSGEKKKELIIIDDEAGKVTIIPSNEDSLERLSEIDRQFPDNKPGIEDYIEMKLMLDYALSFLPKQDRRLIEMYYFEGYGMDELSTIFKISIRTLYDKMNRILCKLNEILKN